MGIMLVNNMQKFSIEVNIPIELTLTDNKRGNESKAVLEIVPTKNDNGFVIFIKNMTDHVSYMDERESNWRDPFIFDKEAFEKRMMDKFGEISCRKKL